MDAKEGMAGRGEHRISVVENAGGSGERVGTGIHEEGLTSPAIEPSVDEPWIKGAQEKIEHALHAEPAWSLHSHLEGSLKIRPFLPGMPIYQRTMVTIGPYFDRESQMIANEEKWLIVHFINCLYSLDLAGCLIKMKNQAADAFKCYYDSDISEFSGVEFIEGFAEMLLLDSYFILFMLMFGEILGSDSPIASMENLLSRLKRIIDLVILQRDDIVMHLLIVDNQIPFFVIEELFKELKSEKQPLHTYALKFFEKIHPWSNQGRRKGQNDPPEFLHLLDLFHWSRVPPNKYEVVSLPNQRQLESFDWARYIPTAMELRESATMFEKKTSGSPLDITFHRGWLIPDMGVLNIPSLRIRDYSNFVFCNLIAFEIQFPSRGHCTMAFSAFMRNLLRSEEDVKLLRRRGILVSTYMTDGELVDFFKGLSQLIENYQIPNDLHIVYNQIFSHHNRRVSRFYGNIILQYFPNPLVTLSVFAAALLFVLTVLQTLYSTLGYYHM